MLVGSTCNFLLSLNTSFVRFVSQVSVMDPPTPLTSAAVLWRPLLANRCHHTTSWTKQV